jgi:hypothetical protein
MDQKATLPTAYISTPTKWQHKATNYTKTIKSRRTPTTSNTTSDTNQNWKYRQQTMDLQATPLEAYLNQQNDNTK